MLEVNTRVKVIVQNDAVLNGVYGTVVQVNTRPGEWQYQVKLDMPVSTMGTMGERTDLLWFDREELEVISGGQE